MDTVFAVKEGLTLAFAFAMSVLLEETAATLVRPLMACPAPASAGGRVIALLVPSAIPFVRVEMALLEKFAKSIVQL